MSNSLKLLNGDERALKRLVPMHVLERSHEQPMSAGAIERSVVGSYEQVMSALSRERERALSHERVLMSTAPVLMRDGRYMSVLTVRPRPALKRAHRRMSRMQRVGALIALSLAALIAVGFALERMTAALIEPMSGVDLGPAGGVLVVAGVLALLFAGHGAARSSGCCPCHRKG